MRARLTFAFIAFVFGLALSAVLWGLFGLGLSMRPGTPALQPDFWVWAKYVGGGFAVAGFLLKERAADLVAGVLGIAYEHEAGTQEWHVPTWLVVVSLAAVIAMAWYFAARS
jgi:hypothetical protein